MVVAKPEEVPKPGVVFDEVPNKDGVVGWPKGDEKLVLVAGVFWLNRFGVLGNVFVGFADGWPNGLGFWDIVL